jgi:hypothetical protein
MRPTGALELPPPSATRPFLLVKTFLEELASKETETERLKRQEREIRSRISEFNASPRLSREEVHRRSN